MDAAFGGSIQVGEERAPLVNSNGARSAHRCSADIVAIKASIITPLIEASCLEATGQIVQITSALGLVRMYLDSWQGSSPSTKTSLPMVTLFARNHGTGTFGFRKRKPMVDA